MGAVDDYLAGLDEPVRIALDHPLPGDVARDIVRLRAKEISG